MNRGVNGRMTSDGGDGYFDCRCELDDLRAMNFLAWCAVLIVDEFANTIDCIVGDFKPLFHHI